MESVQRVHIFDYLDYRAFLRDFYKQQKSEGRSFSFRAFARRAQIRSFNFLPLVMKGERDLSSAMAVRFAKGCGLDSKESAYFCELVAFGQAQNTEERNRVYERLRRFRAFREAQKLEPAQSAYHSSWYFPAIRELVALPNFRDDPKWIAGTLRPAITTVQAKQALSTLLELGLLVRNADGHLVQATECVTTGAGPLGHHVVNYHREMMTRAIAALDEVPREERDISSVTLTVSARGFAELRERIAAFRREILQRADTSGPADRVVQLNVQLFPLSETPEGQP